MGKTNDDLMHELLTAKRNGERIFYGKKDAPLNIMVEDDHCWDLANNRYKVHVRREFIIRIDDRDKDNPRVQYTTNNWTRSDFGRDEIGEHILMREVYQDEM